MSDKAVVYRAFDAADTLLYVGCTVALDARMRDHERHSPWWLFHCRLEVQRFASWKAALLEEVRVIQTEYPRWNARDRAHDHPDGPLGRSITSTPHLRLEVETWRDWNRAKTAADRRRIRREARAA